MVGHYYQVLETLCVGAFVFLDMVNLMASQMQVLLFPAATEESKLGATPVILPCAL